MADIINADYNNDGFADADLNKDGILSAEEIITYRKHVVQYFDEQLGNDILALNADDKSRCFQMMTDYADIREKLFHPGIDILEHIQGKRFAAALADPHEGINWDYDCPIIREYDEWKVSKS